MKAFVHVPAFYLQCSLVELFQLSPLDTEGLLFYRLLHHRV